MEETKMIEKLIAAAVLSLGASAIGKAKAKYREKHPKQWPWELAAELKTLDRQQFEARLAACSRNMMEQLCHGEGVNATWCKSRAEMEDILRERFGKKRN